MKIAQIVSTFPPYRGGMGNSVWHYSAALLVHHHELTIFTPRYRQTPLVPAEETIDGLHVVRLSAWLSIGRAAIMRALGKRLKNFDIIHLHYPFFGTAEIVAWQKMLHGKKIKLVLHYHMDTRSAGLKGLIFSGYRYLLLPLLARLADEITCASLDYIKHSALAAYYQKHPNKFNQVPFGVAKEKFQPCPDLSVVPTVVPTVLFVGALDKQHYFKGVDKLLEAFAIVSSRLPESRLLIVGHGDLADAYRIVASELDLAAKVNFINDATDQDLIKYYQQCSVLVLPSINHSEAFGLVLLEAMACGKPVVATKLPGVRGVFKKGRQGLLARPGDTEDLAKKILTILLDEDLAAKMGQAARKLVEKQYSWDRAAEKLNEIYYRVRYTPKKL